MTMAEPQSVIEWLEIELDKLSADDKISLVMEIAETLEYPQILRIRNLLTDAYEEKAEKAKQAVIDEMYMKFMQFGLSLEDVLRERIAREKSKQKTTLPPKYRSPDGLEWTGRGRVPQWLREIEEQGGDRNDYLITDEG
jgi:DNA-binding protein H-NS